MFILVCSLNCWAHLLELAKKNQKISIADLDIGMNSFTEFVLQGLQGSVYFHDIVADKNLFTSEKIIERIGYSRR